MWQRGGVPNDDEMKKPRRGSIKTLTIPASLDYVLRITTKTSINTITDKYLGDNLVICEKGNDVIAVRRHQTTPRIRFF